jgi:hypothetical protein
MRVLSLSEYVPEYAMTPCTDGFVFLGSTLVTVVSREFGPARTKAQIEQLLQGLHESLPSVMPSRLQANLLYLTSGAL